MSPSPLCRGAGYATGHLPVRRALCMNTPTAPTILLIEDNVVVRSMLETALAEHGYTVAPAATVQEAEAARQRLGLAGIDLVVADVHLSDNMQAQEGIVLVERWLAMRPTLPRSGGNGSAVYLSIAEP